MKKPCSGEKRMFIEVLFRSKIQILKNVTSLHGELNIDKIKN